MLVTRSALVDDLGELRLRSDAVVMVHCRLSALGHVVGGAEVVVRALLDVVGPGGTLVAYTGWQDAPPDDIDALAGAERRGFFGGQAGHPPPGPPSRPGHRPG